MAAAILVGAISCTSGQSDGGVRDEPEQQAEQPVDRPNLDEIFRDDGYVFRPVAPAKERAMEGALQSDRGADEAIDKIVVRKALTKKRDSRAIFVMATILSDVAVDDPDNWEGVLRGMRSWAPDLQTDTLSGADIAYAEIPGGRVIVIDYAPDLVLGVFAKSATRRGEMERLGRHLLRLRD